MSWRLIARQGIREAWRNWELRGTMIGFSLVFALIGYYAGPHSLGSSDDPQLLFGFLTGVMLVLIPATAVALSHADVAGRREDGRLRLVFGQPFSRRDVVIGQYVASAVTVLASVVVAVASGVLVASLSAGALAPAKLTLALLGVGLCLGATFLGIGIAISTASRTTDFTGAMAFGAFVVFTFVWSFVPRGVLWAIDHVVSVDNDPWWLVYVDTVSPVQATGRVMAPGVSLPGLPGGDQTAVYVFGILVLIWWIVVFPALALRRFEASDL